MSPRIFPADRTAVTIPHFVRSVGSKQRRKLPSVLLGLGLGLMLHASTSLAYDIELISVNDQGLPGNGVSSLAAISRDGLLVGFSSTSSDLVDGDTDGGLEDVFVHDTLTGVTRMVSDPKSSYDHRAPEFSPDAKFVAFVLDAVMFDPRDLIFRATRDVFVHDLEFTDTEWLNTLLGGSTWPNGRLPLPDERLPDFPHGTYRPTFSADNCYVAFSNANSARQDLEPAVFVYDICTPGGSLEELKVGTFSIQPVISDDGCQVAFITDGSSAAAAQVFRYDFCSDSLSQVSVASSGEAGDDDSSLPFMSSDGRFVAFSSFATNLDDSADNEFDADVFVHDMKTQLTERITIDVATVENVRVDRRCSDISADGRFVVFESSFLGGNTKKVGNVFVHDRLTGETELISVANDGSQTDGDSFGGKISADGRYIAFVSRATNLVATGDPGVPSQVFLVDRGPRFAEQSLIDAAVDMLSNLAEVSFIDPDRRTKLLNELSKVEKALNEDKLAKSIDKLDKLIVRMDGCTLRSVPDDNQTVPARGIRPKEDYITNCDDQIAVYEILESLRTTLSP